ncbi:MAG: outer membrane beta-barrel protein [Pseudobdellovibrionaceae bacterium]|nr:MAG: outer membrane beta-barrel protein [Pseudobdellovibrionaceae bacterium]
MQGIDLYPAARTIGNKDWELNVMNHHTVFLFKKTLKYRNQLIVGFTICPLSCIGFSQVSSEYSYQKPKPTVKMHFAGIMNMATPDVKINNESVSIEKNLGYGASVAFEVYRSRDISLETEANFVRKKYRIRNAQSMFEHKVDSLQFPLMARFHLTEAFNVGLGPYLRFRIGQPKQTLLIGTKTDIVDSSAEDETEFGFITSIAYRHRFNPFLGAFADARFSSSVSDSQDISGLAGISIGFEK